MPHSHVPHMVRALLPGVALSSCPVARRRMRIMPHSRVLHTQLAPNSSVPHMRFTPHSCISHTIRTLSSIPHVVQALQLSQACSLYLAARSRTLFMPRSQVSYVVRTSQPGVAHGSCPTAISRTQFGPYSRALHAVHAHSRIVHIVRFS